MSWFDEPEDSRPTIQPPASYKDCGNCGWKDGMEEPERRDLCESCPVVYGTDWESLPCGPPERFLQVAEWASIPIEAHDLTEFSYMDLRDLESYRAGTRRLL